MVGAFWTFAHSMINVIIYYVQHWKSNKTKEWLGKCNIEIDNTKKTKTLKMLWRTHVAQTRMRIEEWHESQFAPNYSRTMFSRSRYEVRRWHFKSLTIDIFARYFRYYVQLCNFEFKKLYESSVMLSCIKLSGLYCVCRFYYVFLMHWNTNSSIPISFCRFQNTQKVYLFIIWYNCWSWAFCSHFYSKIKRR